MWGVMVNTSSLTGPAEMRDKGPEVPNVLMHVCFHGNSRRACSELQPKSSTWLRGPWLTLSLSPKSTIRVDNDHITPVFLFVSFTPLW